MHQLERTLGLNHRQAVALVGVGNLGTPSPATAGFGGRGFPISALFDVDPDLSASTSTASSSTTSATIPAVCAERGITIGVIATPAQAAQEVCDLLVAGGVRCILNFAPVVLQVPDEVEVRKVDLAVELQILAFHVARRHLAAARHGGRGRRPRSTATPGERIGECCRECAGRRAVAPQRAGRGAGARRRAADEVAEAARRAAARRRTSSEAMLLSTCNRVEVYAVVDAFHGGLADVSAVLARHTGMALTELTEHLYVHYAGSAVQHLFAVAAGLDSMVVGEAQILGQLRAAYAAADEAGTVGRVLHELAQQALRVGKRVHAEHRHRRGGRLRRLRGARRRRPPPAGRRPGRAPGARRRGRARWARWPPPTCAGPASAEIVVLNRSPGPGRAAGRDHRDDGTPARAGGAGRAGRELAAADLLVACTGAVGAVVRARHASPPRWPRAPGAPLAVCDLGLPRDVDPARRRAARRHG